MDIVIAIIGSSAFGAVVSFIFTWISNRKLNSLNYITEERRKWRDKIREIIIGINESSFEGRGKRNINRYLTQLKVNINPYGKHDKIDYAKDGKKKKKIKKFDEIRTEVEFEETKCNLLEYLELMLKKDWERSKNEVRGYSYTIVCVGIMTLFTTVYLYLCFYIFSLHDVSTVVLLIVLINCTVFLEKVFFIDKLDIIEKNKKRMPIRLMIKKERKERRITIQGALCIIIVLIFNIIIGEYFFPEKISQNMLYCKEKEQIFLYSDLDSNFVSDLQKNLQILVDDEVVMVNDKSELPVKPERNSEDDKILVKAIKNSIVFWNLIINIIAILVPVTGMLFLIKKSDEDRKYTRAIDKVNLIESLEHENVFRQINGFMDRINYSDKKLKKANATYLGIIYSFLNDIKVNLDYEINKNDMLYRNIHEYDDMVQKKDKLNKINEVMKQLRHINRAVTYKKKNEMLESVKQSIINMQPINNLPENN